MKNTSKSPHQDQNIFSKGFPQKAFANYPFSFYSGNLLIFLFAGILFNLSPSQQTIPTIEKIHIDSLPESSFEKRLQNHCSFRGPLGTGGSIHKNLPVEWNAEEGKNLLWKVPLEKIGYNSPIIWEDRLFLSSSDSIEKMIHCFNRHTGDLLWEKNIDNVEGSPKDFNANAIIFGLSLPTLTTDGKRLYGIFASGDLISLDLDGNQVWSRNLGIPDNQYGHGSSLIWWEEKLYIQYDTNTGGILYAINSSTGEILWQTERKNLHSGWSSPILASIGGEYQLVLSANPYVAGYDLENGKMLWSVDCMSGELATSLAAGGDLIFAGNEYAKLVAINPKDSVKIIWEDFEHLPEAASPVFSEGLLYVATRTGYIVCYDAQTGKKYWEYESDDGFFSSPFVADGKLYALDFLGTMFIFNTGKEMDFIGKALLGENVAATPACADSRIYIRSYNHLYCFGNE